MKRAGRSTAGWPPRAISLIGTRVSMIALPWFVLTTTGSPEKTGLVALAEMLPLVVLKVLGGPIIDRVGARRVAITCDWASLRRGRRDPAPARGRAAVVPRSSSAWSRWPARCAGPGDAAKHAMTPTLAATAGVPMERVTGLQLDGRADRRRCSAPRSPAAWSP